MAWAAAGVQAHETAHDGPRTPTTQVYIRPPEAVTAVRVKRYATTRHRESSTSPGDRGIPMRGLERITCSSCRWSC